jgi:glycosyltransferase involved in cell wall biosynthesis
MYLSVVLPAYNEASAIQAGKLAGVADWLAQQPYAAELLVVDDGSSDETARLARCARLAEAVVARVISIEHAGKAAAIVAGVQQARGEVVLLSDMDQATPISEAPKLLKALQDAEVAIGSRGLRRAGAPPGRYLLSWGQVALRQVLLGIRIADTQCGFKAFKREAGLSVLERLCIYGPACLGAVRGPSVTSGFDVEFLYVAHRLGYQIREVPVAWSYQATRRVNLTRDAWRGLRDLIRILSAAGQGHYPPESPGRR